MQNALAFCAFFCNAFGNGSSDSKNQGKSQTDERQTNDHKRIDTVPQQNGQAARKAKQKQAQQIMRCQQAFYHKEADPAAIAVFSDDTDGSIPFSGNSAVPFMGAMVCYI